VPITDNATEIAKGLGLDDAEGGEVMVKKG
jgi:hypothetical protein